MITYLTYKEIDKQKWDECIRGSSNGLIYAESVYLNHMSPNWDALIIGNYDAVMPLTWKRKWGIRYLYQPAFTQQGGIFSRKRLSAKQVKSFIDLAATKFKFAEFNINYANSLEPEKNLKVLKRNNFILPLGNGYKNIFSGYNSYIKQRLSRLKKFSLKYATSEDYIAVIKLYKKLYRERMPSVTTTDFQQFEKLCKYFLKSGRVEIREAYDHEGIELLAAILLFKDNKRLYNVISCILPAGKKALANYFLYNELIREFSNQDIILDFEGSDIPGVSYFYNKFSVNNQRFSFVKFNNLPMPIKLLKK
ncbi:MAG: GNAT family N-acetyltransferase [Ferruginibacter sp.]